MENSLAMETDDESIEVQYERADSENFDTEDMEVGLSQPEIVVSPDGSALFEITAIASGENAIQLVGDEPQVEPDEAVIEVEASPERSGSPRTFSQNSDSTVDYDAVFVEQQCEHEETRDPSPTLVLRPASQEFLTEDEDEDEPVVHELPLNDQDEILSYSKGIIKVEDFKNLDHRMMLNGNILDYWMYCIYHELLTDEQRQQSHFYDTSFFTTLAVSSNFSGWNKGENRNLTAAEKRYNRVKDLPCNQNVNIFEKDFIVIPCLENEHWFLAIVCYPRMNGSQGLDSNRNRKQPRTVQSCIQIFDSSPDSQGRGIGAIIKIQNFLKMTHSKKYKSDFKFKSPIGIKNEVPQQSNTTDCGLFVLQFIESFFKDPPQRFGAPMKLKNWFESARVKQKRVEISRSIIEKYVDKNGVAPRLPPVTLFQK